MNKRQRICAPNAGLLGASLVATATLAISGAVVGAAEPAKPAPATHPNILFIAIDDLRDWANYLGCKQAKTPNMDRLASMGVAFTRSYCAAPLCNVSRTALLTGLRPSTTGVYTNEHDWRLNKVATSVPTIPTYFREHGYTSYASGKIYHESMRKADEWDDYAPILKLQGVKGTSKDKGIGIIRFRPLDCDDDVMPDYKTVSYCIDKLQRRFDKPLLLGCGFTKPHLPLDVPKKYYDMYPLDEIELPKVSDTDLDDVPAAGVAMANDWSDNGEVRKSGRWKEAVRAYLATVTFVDTQLGRLLDAFENSDYKDDTIIVMWSDHGWHLGEKNHWTKFTLWEEATRSPLIWVAPGVTKPGGMCHRTTDFMDMYPTLCDLAGLPIPKHVEGVSIRSLLEDPKAVWERPAIMTYKENNHAVRSEKWRYIRYADGSEELYDHDIDPLEETNLAKLVEYSAVKDSLKQWIPKVNVPSPPEDVKLRKRRSASDGEGG